MKLTKRADIDALLSKPFDTHKACLVYGRDRGQVIERGLALSLKIVADPKDPFNVSLLTETEVEADAARIEDELSAQSLMGGRRLVRLKYFNEKSNLDKSITQALKAHLNGEYQSDAFFLIEAGALGADSALRRLAEADKAMPTIALYEDETGDIIRMARETLAENEVALTPEAMDLFANRLPKERGIARQEIERLCLFIGPKSRKTLNEQDLLDFLGVEPEASLFQAAQDVFGGKMKPAQACLRRAFAEGEGGTDSLRALSGHVFKLRLLQAYLDQGSAPKDACKAAGIFWKQEAEFLRQVRAWTQDLLDPIGVEILEADKLCRSTGLPDRLLAERLFMSIAARAQRLGL
jgi:DNA polymerase-3 subunit delta